MELAPHIREAFHGVGVVIDSARQSKPNGIDIKGHLVGGTPVEYLLSLHCTPSCYGYLITSCTEEAADTWEPIQAALMAGPKNHCSHVVAWSDWVYKRSRLPIDLSGVRKEAISVVLAALRG